MRHILFPTLKSRTRFCASFYGVGRSGQKYNNFSLTARSHEHYESAQIVPLKFTR